MDVKISFIQAIQQYVGVRIFLPLFLLKSNVIEMIINININILLVISIRLINTKER